MKNRPHSHTVHTCRTCKWLNVPPDKNGKIVPRKGGYHRCTVQLPPPPPMPASIRVNTTERGGGYGLGNLDWPTSAGYMGVDDGEGCTFHEPRLK